MSPPLAGAVLGTELASLLGVSGGSGRTPRRKLQPLPHPPMFLALWLEMCGCGQLSSPWCPGPRRDTGWGPEGTWKSYGGLCRNIMTIHGNMRKDRSGED